MDMQLLWVFVSACFALNMAFGPNNLLSVTNSVRFGPFKAILASLGRIAAFIPMIVVAGIGLGTLLATSIWFFTVVKWLGAAYLAWLGLKLIMSPPQRFNVEGDSEKSLKQMAKQEFFVAAGNPKAILIFTAFFPQFVIEEHYAWSFATLGGLFIFMELVAVSFYSLIGGKVGRYLSGGKAFQYFNRASGGIMIIFGIGLLALKRPE